MNNVYLIDKPKGQTSFDIVKRLKKTLNIKKIGHTGTLDPFATGLLIICTGSFTRLSDYFHQYLKTYRAVFTLGAFTDTDDITGETIEEFSLPPITEKTLTEELKKFTGEIEQLPPHISAKKINGQRLYKINREKRVKEPKKAKVFVKEIKILTVNLPDIEVEIICGTGTYIRSIARDLGKNLKCGCFVKELRRTKIGPYSVNEAKDAENPSPLPHLNILPEMEAFVFDAKTTERILNGNEIALSEEMPSGGKFRLFSPYFEKLLAICKIEQKGGKLKAKAEKVFERKTL